MSCWRRTLPGQVIVAAFLLSFSCLSGAEPFRCADSRVIVEAGPRVDQQRVCAAAEEAATFLGALGLNPKVGTTITIELLNALPQHSGGHAIGQFDYRRNRIEILTYDAAVAASTKYPSAFGLPMSRALWKSYVVHELAHAAAQPHFAPGAPMFTASEYIAAVAQLSTLSPEVRELILANYADAAGFANESEISELFYFVDPCKFAVKAYRHYLTPGNGMRFIERLLRHGLPN